MFRELCEGGTPFRARVGPPSCLSAVPFAAERLSEGVWVYTSWKKG